jgi:hypothetical protein
VRVEVRDDGRGFDAPLDSAARASERFGIRGAVVEGLQDVGGTAEVMSADGAGTRVLITWAPSEPAVRVASHLPAASAFAIPLLLSFGLFTTAIVVLTRSQVADPGVAALSYGIFVGLSVLIGWSSMRGPLPWWVVCVVAGVSPLLYQLQSNSVAAGEHSPWSDWSSGAIVALFVVAAGAGPGWSWLVLLVCWLFIQGDMIHELFAEGTALILSAALFGRSTRHNAHEVEQYRAKEVAARAASAVAEQESAGIRGRYGALGESTAVYLLEGIADRSIDPESPAARHTAAIEERFIRTIMRVDPAQDSVRALASSLAVDARRRGVFLDVHLTESAPPPQTPTPGGRQSLEWAVTHTTTGGVARLSARTEGDDYVIRLIAPVPAELRDDARALPVPGLALDPSDDDMLWELRQKHGGVHD